LSAGDLKNPNLSIPAGTIAAQLTTSFIYFSLALVFGAAIDGAVLRDKYGQSLRGGMIVANLSWPTEWLLLIGSFLSTFGAALQCLCSAPRLLQSIAKDDVIPVLKPFAKVTKKNEPFKGCATSPAINRQGRRDTCLKAICESYKEE
uniref:AA_permease domain-containing protein n=1 Tax=Gongylonema pulchrum TaxID=637853 RepID=A0A183E7X3_9BILA